MRDRLIHKIDEGVIERITVRVSSSTRRQKQVEK